MRLAALTTGGVEAHRFSRMLLLTFRFNAVLSAPCPARKTQNPPISIGCTTRDPKWLRCSDPRDARFTAVKPWRRRNIASPLIDGAHENTRAVLIQYVLLDAANISQCELSRLFPPRMTGVLANVGGFIQYGCFIQVGQISALVEKVRRGSCIAPNFVKMLEFG